MGDKLNGEEYFEAGAAQFNYNNVVSPCLCSHFFSRTCLHMHLCTF